MSGLFQPGLSHKAGVAGLPICFFVLFVPFVIVLAHRLPFGWFLIPGCCFGLVLFLRYYDLRGVVLYWAMLSVQFWGVFLILVVLMATRWAFLASSFWLIWEIRRFLQIELLLNRRLRTVMTYLIALALSIFHVLIV